MTTIDLTPTHEAYARICYYILSSHGANQGLMGEYWSLTADQETALIKTYCALDNLLEPIGQSFWRDAPKAWKTKTINKTLAQYLNGELV